ncbi:hypothetical protein IMCC26134_05050 [Verrucomicrobia bacterium IMCC26134]|nr:hypothetical protein IMCC26134_05050 [Verrucomicrobia bacterium IMCC26134]
MKPKTGPVILATILAAIFLAVTPSTYAKEKKKSKGATSSSETAPKLPPNPVAIVMQRYDSDKDGRLSTVEITTMAAADSALAQTAKSHDSNSDNTLDSNEINTWRIDEDHKAGGAAQESSKPKKKKKQFSE